MSLTVLAGVETTDDGRAAVARGREAESVGDAVADGAGVGADGALTVARRPDEGVGDAESLR